MKGEENKNGEGSDDGDEGKGTEGVTGVIKNDRG